MARRPLLNWRASLFVLLHFLSINNNNFCDAQLLSAYEQAYGPWNIKLTKNIFGRRRWHLQTLLDNDNKEKDNDIRSGSSPLHRKRGRRKIKADGDLQLLFPENNHQKQQLDKANNDAQDTTTAANNNDGKDKTQLHSRSNEQSQYAATTKSVRSVSCILNLEKTGKFTLSLLENGKENPKNALFDSSSRHDDQLSGDTKSLGQQEATSSNHQSLQGEWYLTPNPYCVTDRHFDTLLLVSEPRMRRRRRRRRSTIVVEKATVELRCKVWGRYGVGAVRETMGFQHGRVKGRMTHGTILIVKEEEQVVMDGGDDDVGKKRKKKLPTREVVGTFRGKTMVDFDSDDGKKCISKDGHEQLLDAGDEDEDEDVDLDFGDNFDDFGVLRPITGE